MIEYFVEKGGIMFVAGIILLSIGAFFTIVSIAVGADDGSVALSLFFVFSFYFTVPGIVFLCVGNKIRKNRFQRQSSILPSVNNRIDQNYYYKCSKCNYQLFEDYNCCPNCGTKVSFELESNFCTQCGKELEESFKCCPYCGKKR